MNGKRKHLVGVLSTLFLFPTALAAAPDVAPAPWSISDGTANSDLYVPRHIEKAYEKGTRNRDGKPGPNYWQNHSTHKIKVSIAPPSRRVQGEQEIVYTNNSPDALPVLIFRMYMNAHQPEAMREAPIGADFMTSGITVESFSVDRQQLEAMNGNDRK